jgi:ferric-dicitrate binding protein FerR (iron transport regulator)
LAGALDSYAPKARTEFRDRLRAEFVAGTIPERVSSAGYEADEAASASHVLGILRARWRPLVVLAAAAALVLWILRPVEPSWSVDPEGFVAVGMTIDGRVLSKDTPFSEVADLLSRAKEVTTAAHPVRLVLGELFVVEMAESSTLDLSRMPADLGRGDLVLHGVEGGFRVATGPEFEYPQRKLRIETQDVNVEVVGTVFGVDLYSDFTCVCCLEGEVSTTMHTKPATFGVVEAETTNIVHKDGKAPEKTHYAPHMVRLTALREFWER